MVVYLRRLLYIAVFVLFTVTSAQATLIEYEILDLPDTTTGEDIWQYRYHVSGQSFPTYYGFDIFFLLNNQFLFGDLETSPLAPSANWDVTATQPDIYLPHNGFYEAVALVDDASLSDVFSLDFIWRGAGSPGSQPFEIFDDTLSVIENGMTVPYRPAAPGTVPEPGTLLLVGFGIGGLLIGKKLI